MLTRTQGKAQKRAIAREITKDLKAKDRAKVKTLDAELRAARVKRDAALERARERCRTDRLAVRARVEALREEAHAKLSEAVRLERETARAACAVQKTEARTATVPAVERAKRELDAERVYQEELARIAASHRKRRADLPRASRAEHRSESDDEVRANIAPDLVPLFDKVRAKIKGSAHASRTEAFLQYAEEHPNEVLGAIEDESDGLVRQLEERFAKETRETRSRSRQPRPVRRKYTPEELADVPF